MPKVQSHLKSPIDASRGIPTVSVTIGNAGNDHLLASDGVVVKIMDVGQSPVLKRIKATTGRSSRKKMIPAVTLSEVPLAQNVVGVSHLTDLRPDKHVNKIVNKAWADRIASQVVSGLNRYRAEKKFPKVF